MDRLLFAVVLLIISSVTVVQSAPYILLTNTRSKCVSVIAPMENVVTIRYQVPDMVLTDGSEDPQNAPAATLDRQVQDGMDAEWNRRMKDKIERMKTKQMRDMTVTVTQKDMAGSAISRERRNSDSELGRGKIREELTQKQGEIEFWTAEVEGTVEICIQSVLANRNMPQRVQLDISLRALDDDDHEEDGTPKTDANGRMLGHQDIQTQMSRLERDLSTLKNRVRAILNNADYNKEQESDFHAQSVAMNRAAVYWPIIQLIVVLLTGFTQANHIVRYMRSHHVGI